MDAATLALATEHSEAIVPGGNGVFKPTIVIDGEVVATCVEPGPGRSCIGGPLWPVWSGSPSPCRAIHAQVETPTDR